MRKHMQYDDEFKKEAIRLAKEGDKSRLAIAMDLGVAPSTLNGWVSRSKESKEGEIITGSEITRLRKELADVKLERDILKKAVAIFSKASR